jgi:hypothetical protein
MTASWQGDTTPSRLFSRLSRYLSPIVCFDWKHSEATEVRRKMTILTAQRNSLRHDQSPHPTSFVGHYPDSLPSSNRRCDCLRILPALFLAPSPLLSLLPSPRRSPSHRLSMCCHHHERLRPSHPSHDSSLHSPKHHLLSENSLPIRYSHRNTHECRRFSWRWSPMDQQPLEHSLGSADVCHHGSWCCCHTRHGCSYPSVKPLLDPLSLSLFLHLLSRHRPLMRSDDYLIQMHPCFPTHCR